MKSFIICIPFAVGIVDFTLFCRRYPYAAPNRIANNKIGKHNYLMEYMIFELRKSVCITHTGKCAHTALHGASTVQCTLSIVDLFTWLPTLKMRNDI